nr:hypothetical protein [Bacteroidota bacterium]
WKGYAANLRERRKDSLANSADKAEPEFSAEGGVIIKVLNDSLKNMFYEDKLSLTDFLNSKFNISNIHIVFVTELPTEQQEKEYEFRPGAIFKQMVELNPALAELQKRLDLRIDR